MPSVGASAENDLFRRENQLGNDVFPVCFDGQDFGLMEGGSEVNVNFFHFGRLTIWRSRFELSALKIMDGKHFEYELRKWI